MKVCERCGDEIDGRDGENLCPVCDQAEANNRRRAHARERRRERDQAMRDLGMVKVRGNLGGTYWE